MFEQKTKVPLLRFDDTDAELVSKRVCYHGFFSLDEYKVRHKLFSGEQSPIIKREIFERGDAVVLIPYDPDKDTVVMIEQFRPGAMRFGGTPWLLEFVAGMFSKDESPQDVAIREAKEEANLDVSVNELTFVMKYLSSPGGMTEAIHLYAAPVDSTNVGGVYGLDCENEDILVHAIPFNEAVALLNEGKITNAASVIGLQWLQLHRQSLGK
ncbi:NUDIX domain-containing protein [Thalassotalea fusca]